jgi:hypothetical protein
MKHVQAPTHFAAQLVTFSVPECDQFVKVGPSPEQNTPGLHANPLKSSHFSAGGTGAGPGGTGAGGKGLDERIFWILLPIPAGAVEVEGGLKAPLQLVPRQR